MNKLLIALSIATFGLTGVAMAQTPEQPAPAASKATKHGKKPATRKNSDSHPAGVNLTGDQSNTPKLLTGKPPTSIAERNAGLSDTGKKIGGFGSK